MQLLQTGRHLQAKFGFNYEVMEYLDEGHWAAVCEDLEDAG